MSDGIYIDLRPPHPDDVAFMQAVQDAMTVVAEGRYEYMQAKYDRTSGRMLLVWERAIGSRDIATAHPIEFFMDRPVAEAVREAWKLTQGA